MSTHRRAWKQRAGVVVALVAGALLAVPATPALAADPGVQITGLSSGTLTSGQRATLSFRVTNNNVKLPPLNSDSVTIKVSTSFGELSCDGRCDFTEEINRGESGTYTVNLVAGNVAPGDTKSGKVQISASVGGDSDSAERDITVRGPQQQQTQTVRSVSGKVVVQADGKAVPNAVVMLQDSTGRRYDTTSDGSGNFRFTGTTEKPIAPGRIDLGASFDNVLATKTLNASANQSITGQRISLAIKVEVTPSPTPSASAEATPTEEATEEGAEDQASEEASPGAAANAANEDDGGGFGSYLIILLGGLLVAAGVGTIVLLWMKRKENGDDEDAPAGAGAVPAARGGFRGADDQTRVVGRPGGGPDPTMVGGAALSEAPTMMHRPVVDDVPPDPYGAPAQPYGAAGQQGWGGAGYGEEPAPAGYGGYGNAPASGGGYGTAANPEGGYGAGAAGDAYGAAPGSGAGYGGAPASGGGYGGAPASGGGYGGAPASGGGYGSRDYTAPAGAAGGAAYGERFDEPTGRYTGDSTQYPAPADPYATGVYQPEQGQGYGQPDPTTPYSGRTAEPTGGYGQQAGGYDQGGYGQQAGGYDQGGGYGQEPPQQRGGYDDRGGYDQSGGYGQQAGGYDQGGGYGQEPPQQRGGYDDRGGYDQSGGYGQQTGRTRPDTPPPTERGGRRLDWLDD
ncbi:carboxypeptidase regulatory-like domain-containing protein [Micromonospora sp. NBC_00858]|uniref:carboxypeptidase regulatory-like domain-containing protein n=1 Tax=Micromonospora sp. NBC_00858 TaxID=2975979 RepID=UPI00386B4484|nr:carboxypeptidase regulatory-like domain-containing protein [Micromonospora sp. NBC_00858]